MLSLAELEHAVDVLAGRIVGQRIQEVVQPDAERVVLTTYGQVEGRGRRQHLVLAGGPETARVSMLPRPPRALATPPAFTQYLRAHAVGAHVVSVSLRGGDRLVELALDTREGAAALLLQIFGRRSNVYYLDAEGRVVAALRSLEATRSELRFGEPWRDPASGPPTRGEDRFREVAADELLEAIEAAYALREAESEHTARARSVEQALRKEEKRLARKREKLLRELEAAREATELARQGELLKASLGQVRRGDSEAVLSDFETGEEVRVALDPAKSPSENLEALFKRYQKAVRRLTKGGAQDDSVRAAVAELDALLADHAALPDDPEALRAFAERPEVQALIARYAPAQRPAAGAPAPKPELKVGGRVVPRRLVPRRYKTAGDLEIWVGRSDAANDFLTTRLARGKDLFFHLDGAPGSHVILRTEGRSDPPSEAVLDACELAVHYSKAKKATRADVHVVPIKNVKKPKGAKPGLVMVHGGKTVHLRRTESRLERVLAARIED